MSSAARRAYGCAGWLDFPGHYGTQTGHDTLDAALAADCDAVIGVGVGGLEVDRTPFAAMSPSLLADPIKARRRGAVWCESVRNPSGD